MIRVEEINKRFSGVHAVRDLTLQVERGEIFGLLGPNGAGKSTTIRMIVDIIRPDTGVITFDGEKIDDDIRARIGYLPEERGLYQKAKILESIVYFGRLKGLSKSSATSAARQWLDRFGLADSENRLVEELSKGNQQKLQVIIALLHDPEYVILDEPTSGLDPVNQGLLREIVNELRNAGKAILYSTHQMDLAERLCDRLALINRGSIILKGTVDEVRRAHGGNSVVVEFSGEGAFLRDLTGVQSGTVDGNRAELELEEGVVLNDLIDQIGRRITLSRLEQVRPSLNTIFLAAVGRSDAPTPEESTAINGEAL